MLRLITEAELRGLLGALAMELGDRLGRMNSYQVAAAVRPRAEALVGDEGLASIDDAELLRVANRWLSEYAVAAAMAMADE